jgi:hypothetical protein
MANQFTKKVKLNTVADNGSFKLNQRSYSPVYKIDRKESRQVFFTGVVSGRSFKRKPGHFVYVKP